MFFDRFDIVEAHYAFASDWHMGQTCELYKRLSRIVGRMRFSPSPMFRGFDSLSENAQEIYKNLEKRFHVRGHSLDDEEKMD